MIICYFKTSIRSVHIRINRGKYTDILNKFKGELEWVARIVSDIFKNNEGLFYYQMLTQLL